MSEFYVKNQKEGWIIQLCAVIFGVLLLTLCATHYSHQRQYERKNSFRCCEDSHCPKFHHHSIVFTWPELSLQTCSVILVMQQLVKMSQFIHTKVEISKPKSGNWPQILNFLNNHRMAKVEGAMQIEENTIENLLQAKQIGTYES